MNDSIAVSVAAGATYSTPVTAPLTKVTFSSRRGSSQCAAAVSSSMSIDWARVRALADPEPVSVIGPEVEL